MIKILAIDDNNDNLVVLSSLLSDAFPDIVVITARSGKEGIEKARAEHPEVILLDLVMPHMDGYETCRILKEDAFLRRIPVIIITAVQTDSASRIKALKLGADTFLSKPIDEAELTAHVSSMLRLKQLEDELRMENLKLDEEVKRRTLELETELKVRKQAEVEILELNKELDQRVRQRTAELEAAYKEMESFSYSISHDLRAPLRHINGFIGLFLETKTTGLTESEQGHLDRISVAAKEMDHLIDAILAFSRLNVVQLRKTKINSSEMVRQVIDFFKFEMQHRNVTLKIGSLPDMQGDEELIGQVWTNLISNALKFTGKRPHAVIEIGSIPDGTQTTYFVKDNGAGFNMKYADKLFGVFQRLHKTSDFEGVGVGLANVNRIIVRHGGHCHAIGEPDQGATFYFTLPN
ncbi:MAG: response regulator [bacterium]